MLFLPMAKEAGPKAAADKLMYEISIKEAGQELHHQILPEGRFNLGRSSENEIYVPNRAISRQHLNLDISRDSIIVTDLGSTNGTRLNGHPLQPHRPTEWPPNESLQIGGLTVHLKPHVAGGTETVDLPEDAASPVDQPPGSQSDESLVFTIVSTEAEPQVTTLTTQPLIVGKDKGCAIRLRATNVAARHCLIQMRGDRVEVTNMDAFQPAKLAGTPLPVGQPVEWRVNEALQLGVANFYLTLRPAADHLAAYKASTEVNRSTWQRWRYHLILLFLAGMSFVCLATVAMLVVQGTRCDGFSVDCLLASFGNSSPEEGTALVQGEATPTLAPVMTNQAPPTGVPTVEFDLGAPTPTSVPVDCAPEASAGTGWLDLPFPYQGIEPIFGGGAENFRRISQRSKFGGRINAFFDHEFPVYPPIFGGREPNDKDETLIIFNGVSSDDAYSQDSDSADWYSGHSGIDFAPSTPREATTPILAAAKGRLLLAKVDDDDNHMVWLEHDPDGDGRYQYATLYFHMHPDQYFTAMMALDERAPIEAGQRIGTMGTTGRSSGVHLHFEVRHDVNRDGRFSIFERVDPYGWFPSQEIVEDPWSVLVSWIDSKGDPYEHQGIQSEYLWVHPLVDVVDTSGECQQVTNVKVDLYNVLGWAVVDPGFTYIARNEQGQILEVGQPHRRTITILDEDLEGVDPNSMSLEWLNPKLDTWFTYKKADLVPNPSGGYTFSAIVDKTGRYVLVAKEVVDRVAPTTSIKLSGDLLGGEKNTFKDSTIVTLAPSDRGLIQSEIVDVQYSLDCGKSWNQYTEPFEVTHNTPHNCGEVGAASETIELGQNDFLMLAMSEDSENNIEQPPAQIRFRIE